jgi:shikimate 5-dehydrogenase
MMDIGCKDITSSFLKAAEENGNETFDGLGYMIYKMMTNFNDILWNKAYKHIDSKRLMAYLKELREYNENRTD